MTKLSEILNSIIDNDLLDDRRSYGIEDLMSTYDITKAEANELADGIQEAHEQQ